MINEKMKAARLVLCLAALAVSCLIYACSAPLDDEAGKDGTFSITINGGNRSVLSWDNSINIDDLVHTITLTDGSGSSIPREGVKAGESVHFTVAPGHWDITVRAYLGSDSVLMAEGFASVDLKPGPNGTVPIMMGEPTFSVITIAAIGGITAPAAGGTPVTSITPTAQYTGTVTWSPAVSGAFEYNTMYTATITLTPQTGCTLTGVAADFFTVAGSLTANNAANSGLVTAVFPVTAGTAEHPAIIDIKAIGGIAAPVTRETPAASITPTAQYTGTVTWSPAVSGAFEYNTMYTATITLTAQTGYTLQGVGTNFFKVAGSIITGNAANSGVVTAVFPATTATVITKAAIGGVTAPAAGGIPVTTITENEQYSGTVIWMPAVSGAFAIDTAYTATIILKPQTGCTMTGVAADFFTVEGSITANNAANSGLVTAVFPATAATVITIKEIGGIAAPAAGGIPPASITPTAQYTGTVSWEGKPSAFADFTIYTATITLTARPGYTLQGVTADFFTVAGATTVSNNVNSGIITAMFKTAAYALGATGPGGGKVFYYDPAGFTMTDNGQVCHYLEAAPANMPKNLAWGSPEYTILDYDYGIDTYISIPGTETGIGTGRKNTALILEIDAGAPAAKACDEYSNNGMTDWFLPSKDELNQLFVNKSYVNNMGFNSYWSSSQIDKRYVWYQLFIYGYRAELNSKDDTHSVRAVRAF